MRIISVASAKGGVGKTTLVSNLGALLASKFSKNVLVMDCNITTSHLGIYLGMDRIPVTLNHVLRGRADVMEAIYNHSSGMKVMPASISITDMKGVDIFSLKNVVKKIEKSSDTDLLLLDCAPGLGREAMAPLAASNEIIYVTTPFLPPVMDVVRCRYAASDMNLNQLGTVLNMVRGSAVELSAEDVERVTEMPVLASIPMDESVIRGMVFGIPAVMSNSKSRLSSSISRLAELILNPQRGD